MAIAGLPMYDLPELRAATDAWWSGLARVLRRAGIENVPEALARPPQTEDIWSAEDLLLSQTCGYNLVDGWRGRLSYVATPCYTAPGCNGPLYSSVILVQSGSPAQSLEGLRGLRCVINGYGSHSGCNALRATIAPLAQRGRFFGSVTVSGSHAQSAAILERGEADVTAIDCVVFALMSSVHPELPDRLRIIGRTVSAPVGPYVTRSSASPEFIERLRHGLAEAMLLSDLASAREALMLDGFEILSGDRYAEITRLERDALERGYGDFSR